MKEALKLELEALKYAASMGHGGIVREMKVTPFTIKEALAQPEQEPCGGCGGSGWVPRDPDIGTDQECFDCNGSGTHPNQPEQEPLAKVEPCAVCGEGNARLLVLRSCDTCHSEYAGQAEMKVALGKPEQEPVAWGFRHHDGAIYDCISPEAHADCEGEYNVPLYDAPPKRPWVGLTDEPTYTEQQIANACWAAEISDSKCESLLIALQEAELKELNT